jgi:hypothetical protein
VKPYQLSMLGLAFDIVGAFLVAVEAIRLENLRALRDRVLRRIHQFTLSPRIVFVDESGRPIGPVPAAVPADRYAGLFMGLHYVAGLLVVVAVNQLLDGRAYSLFMEGTSWVFGRPWYLAVLCVLLFLMIGVVAGLWMLGELVHMGLTAVIRASIRVVDLIDAKTPDGTVGVIGFLLLVAGFLLQMYGSYLGAQPPNTGLQPTAVAVTMSRRG